MPVLRPTNQRRRAMFAPPLPTDNPYPKDITTPDWEATVMYVNDATRTVHDVRAHYGWSYERMRRGMDHVYAVLVREGKVP